MAEPDHIILETGDKIVLEDGTDHLILETSDTAEHPVGGDVVYWFRRKIQGRM